MRHTRALAAALVLGICAAPASSDDKSPNGATAFHNTRPLTADLRPEIAKLGLSVRDQGPHRGTCSVFATTFLIEFQRARDEKAKDPRLSVEYLNWAKNVVTKQVVDGGKFVDIIAGYKAWGMVPEKDMPDLPKWDPAHPPKPTESLQDLGKKLPRYEITFVKDWDHDKGLSEKELQTTLDLIKAGRPVATGIWWSPGDRTEVVNGVALLKEWPRREVGKSPMFDGHSIDLVGYETEKSFPGGGYFVFRNTFGPKWGDEGYGYLSFQYMRDYGNDAIRIVPAK